MYRIIVVVAGDDANRDKPSLWALLNRMRDAGSVQLVSPAGSVEVDIRIINA